MSRADRPYPWRLAAILLGAAVAGYAVKLPFGLLATRALGHGGGFTAMGFVEMALQLAAVLAGLAVYERSGLPGAPWLERRLRLAGAPERQPIWRPALVGALFCMAITVAVSIAARHLGVPSKLGAQLQAPALPRTVLIALGALYPVTTIGAALSEEAVYRLGLVAVLVWAMRRWTPNSARPRGLILWIPIVLVGLLFGWVHVAENLEAVRIGGPVVSTLIAPQTWAGVVFGYLFCVYGFETAVICHAIADLAAPLVLVALGALQRALNT